MTDSTAPETSSPQEDPSQPRSGDAPASADTNTSGPAATSDAGGASAGASNTIVSAVTTIDHERFFLVCLIDALMGLAKRVLSERLVLQSCRWLALIGMWAVVVFAVLVTLWGLIASIQMDTLYLLGTSVVMALVGLALVYTASKFCNAGHKLIDTTPSAMASSSFLDSVALLSGLLALVCLVGGIYAGIRQEILMPVGVGVGLAAWWAYLTAAALNPSLVNASVQPGGSAGQEALGIISFFLKAMLRIAPIAFGVIAAIGTVLFAVDIIRYLAAEEWDRFGVVAQMTSLAGLILVAAALPFGVYLVVVVVYLLVDLARAVLRIRGGAEA